MLIEIISILAGLILIALTCGGAGQMMHLLQWCMDFPTLVCMLVLTVPVLFRNGFWGDFIRAFKLMRKKDTCSLSELKRSLDVLELMQKQILYAGIINTVFPLIYSIALCDDIAGLGPHVTIGLIAVLYTAVLELLLLPAHVEIKRRIINYMEEE